MRRAGRHSVLAVLGVAGAAAVSLPIMALGGPGAEAPDLRADPVEGIRGPAVYSDTEAGRGAGRLLVRFDGFVTNVGQGPLEVSGNPQNGTVRQKAWSAGQSSGDPTVVVGAPPVQYEAADSHEHFHLKGAMRYSLWNQARTAPVVPGQKVGFCLYDIEPAPQPSPPPNPPVPFYDGDVTHFCEQYNPGSTSLRMGTSVGWRDVYGQHLAFQWVDVSDTAPGIYYVGAEADPENVIWEGGGAAEVNPPAFASTAVTVPGWTAQPVGLNQTGGPQAVPLAAQKFGSQSDSNLRYRVTSAPAHGVLNVAGYQDFGAGQQLVYTPTPGYRGADSFTYVASSTSSSFPDPPPAATVSIADTSPAIAISGAPASMRTGTSVQLSAALKNLTGGVAWTASAGSISPTGLYKAPPKVPKGGAAVIRATSTANPAIASQVAIGIRYVKSIASPDPFGRLTAGRRLLSALKIRRVSRRVFVGKVVTGRKGGRIVMTATFRTRVLGRCATRIGARKAFTCKVTLRRSYPLKKVRMTARFTAKNGKVAVRRAFVIRP